MLSDSKLKQQISDVINRVNPVVTVCPTCFNGQ
jgi:hypothetical protein